MTNRVLAVAVAAIILLGLARFLWADEDPILVRREDPFGSPVDHESVNWVDGTSTTTLATPIVVLEAISLQNNPDTDTFQSIIRRISDGVLFRAPMEEMPGGGGGGGVSDHGLLTGLLDDDHTQYVLRTDAVEDLLTNGAAGTAPVSVGGNAMAATNIATQAELDAHAAGPTVHHAAPTSTAPIANSGYAFSYDMDPLDEETDPGATAHITVRMADGTNVKTPLNALGDFVVGGVGGQGNFRGARAIRSTNQSIPNDTITAITFDAEISDTDNIHDNVTNSHRFVAPVDGYYLMTGGARFSQNTTGFRLLLIQIQSGTILAQSRYGAGNATEDIIVTTVRYLTAGQWVNLAARQNSGAALNLTASGEWGIHFTVSLLPDGHDPVVLNQNGFEFVSQAGQELDLAAVTMNSEIDGWILPFDSAGTPGSDLSNLPDSGAIAGLDTPTWANPSRVTADDSSRSVVNAAIDSDPSDALLATDFDLAVPAGALVKGIQINIDGAVQSVSATGSADYEIKLTLDGTTAVGDNKASATVWSANSVDAARLYGGSTDTWGLVLSEAIVNATTFGVSIKVGGSIAKDYQIDAVTLNVYYETAGGEYVVGITSAGKYRAGPGTVENIDDHDNGITIGLGGHVAVNGEDHDETIAGTATPILFGVHDESATDIAIAARRYNATAAAAAGISLFRSRGTIAAPTVVSNGDSLGRVRFYGHDGTDMALAAELLVTVFAAPGSNDMAGQINMLTSPDASQTPASRLTIDSSAVNALVALTESGNAVPNITDTLDFFANTSLADPGEDRGLFWDESDNQYENLDMAALAEDTTPHADSLLMIQQPGVTVLQASKLSDLITAAAPSPYTIGGLTASTAVVPSTDYIGMEITAAGDDRKVLVDEFTADVFQKVAANRTTDQSVSQNTNTAILFTTTEWEDVSTMHDSGSNTSRLVAPIDGIYRVTFWATLASSSTSTTFAMWIDPSNTATNYSTETMELWSTFNLHIGNITADVSLTASAYVEGVVYHNIAGPLNAQGRMSMSRIGDIP